MSDFDREVEQNLPLVSYVLQKHYHIWNEDLFQVGCIGLMNGIKTFDPTKNFTKSTYYYMCIKNEIGRENKLLMRQKRGGGETPLSLNILLEEKTELCDILSVDNSIENDLINKETLKFLYECINELENDEKLIVIYYFGLFNKEQKTQIELSKMLNISQAHISRKLKKLLLKLKGKLENESNNRRL